MRDGDAGSDGGTNHRTLAASGERTNSEAGAGTDQDLLLVARCRARTLDLAFVGDAGTRVLVSVDHDRADVELVSVGHGQGIRAKVDLRTTFDPARLRDLGNVTFDRGAYRNDHFVLDHDRFGHTPGKVVADLGRPRGDRRLQFHLDSRARR